MASIDTYPTVSCVSNDRPKVTTQVFRHEGVQAEGIQGFRLKAGGPNPSAFSLNPFSLPISAYLPE